MALDSDVIVIGGGPAGLAAATLLAQRGVSVTVLDRQSLPADKVCGEGIMPPGLAILEQIGVTRYLSAADQAPFVGIRYVLSSGRSMEADFHAGPGRGVRRTALSAAFRAVAAGCANLHIREGVRVTGVRRGDDHMHVTCENAPPLATRLVIGADGLRSRVRRWADLEGAPAKRKRFGVRQHFHISPWSRFVEVHSAPGVDAYVTPCGPDCTGVAILWEPSRVPHAEPGGRLFASLLDSLPVLRERIAHAEPASSPRSTGPFAQSTKRRTADGIVLLGDASGYLDPCTGEGLTLAFKQALALEACAVPALRNDDTAVISARSLRSYERDWRKIMRSYFLCTRVMLFCLRHPAFFEKLVAYLSPRPGLLRFFLSLNMGSVSLLPGFKPSRRPLVPRDAAHAHAEDS